MIKNFNDWIATKNFHDLKREVNFPGNNSVDMTNNMTPGGNTPLAHADSPSVVPGEAVEEMQIKQQVKTLLGRLFSQFEKMNLSKQKAIELLKNVITEFETEFNLSNSNIRTAMTQANKFASNKQGM